MTSTKRSAITFQIPLLMGTTATYQASPQNALIIAALYS